MRLENYLAQQERYWKAQSQFDSLQYGNRNTSYFHHHASQRKSKNMIISLEANGGTVMSEKEDIEDHIVTFCEHLFSKKVAYIDYEACRAEK